MRLIESRFWLLPISMLIFCTAYVHAAERDADEAAAAAMGHSTEEEEATAPPRKIPDFTKGEPMPPPPKGGHATWQMGPTGIIGMKNGKNEGDQVRVISIYPGSPAEGKILPGDVILGVQGEKFQIGGDINRLTGNAIIDAETEAGKGVLVINMWRDLNWVKRTSSKDMFGVDIDEMFKQAEGGADIYEWESSEEKAISVKEMAFDEFPIIGVYTNFTLQLEVMGTYSETSPWDCPVVQKVRNNALKIIAERLKPDTRGRSKRGGSWPDVLALVASGKPEYVDIAKAWVRRLPTEGRNGITTNMNHVGSVYDVTYGGMQSWHHGFGYLEMAIYYDATGDDYILPEIRKRAICAALGQNGGGSWGHTFAFPHFNGGMLHRNNPGYGAMNNAGGRCFFLLTLAQKFGIDHPEINSAIARSRRFFGTFIDKGCIPYGYHSPWPSDDSNGKNYGPAYAFYTLGDKYAAKFFSMHSAHASFTRRGGHGSPTLWYYTPLSAHMAGPTAVQAYMRNMRYFYTLSRRHDGSFVFLGEQSPGIGGRGMRNSTATVVLHLSRPLEQLVITGKDADSNFYMTDEEYEELLVSARGQIKDPEILKKTGKPLNERDTAELIEMMDHFFPNQRRAIANYLGERYKAGEKEILNKVVAKLSSDEARMRAGACLALSACGETEVMSNLTKIRPLLNDDWEFVRMNAINTVAKATIPGDKERELVLLQAAAEDYEGMTMDNGNVRNTVKGMMFKHYRDKSKYKGAGQLATEPFKAGYDEDLVRRAFERIVTMDPQGTVPGGWDKEALLKLAGPVTFSAEELQMNDAMFGGARKQQAQALLRKHGYQEFVEGVGANLMKRSKLDRHMRRRVTFKDANIVPTEVKMNPGLYKGMLDDLRLWQLDNPVYVLSEKTGKDRPMILTPLHLLIEIIEKNPAAPLPSISPDVKEMFKSELARAGGEDEQLKLCRKELEDLDRKNFFRKIHAMTHLANKLGKDALDDISPFLGHEHWRLREHANKLSVALVQKRDGGDKLVELFNKAQAREPDLRGNWNPAGIIAALADADYKPALAPVRAALKHSDPLVRSTAVQATFKIGGDAELKTVFAFLRQAKEDKDFYGAEKALLSKRDDPAHVKKVSGAAITLLPKSQPKLRRSLAWVLGQFGGAANIAAIQKAAEITEDDEDLKEMALALAYSPDPAASKSMLALNKIDKRIRDIVTPLCLHRLVTREGIGGVSDKDKVSFARSVLNLKYDDRIVEFLGRVTTGASMRLMFDVMKMNPATAAKSIIEAGEAMNKPTKEDAELATDVLTEVIEYIEVTHVRGGLQAHMGDKFEMGAYNTWKDLQGRAGKALLKFNKPKKAVIPTFDDMDLDI